MAGGVGVYPAAACFSVSTSYQGQADAVTLLQSVLEECRLGVSVHTDPCAVGDVTSVTNNSICAVKWQVATKPVIYSRRGGR